MAGMDLTPQILDSPELTAAWVEGSQRIMSDPDRDAGARADAACALLHFLTHGDHDGRRGSIPTTLPAELHDTWQTAFSDRDGAERLPAALAIYQHYANAALADDGDEILRRELDERAALDELPNLGVNYPPDYLDELRKDWG